MDEKKRQQAIENRRRGLDSKVAICYPMGRSRQREERSTTDIAVSLTTSFNYLRAWLERYAVEHVPGGVSSYQLRGLGQRGIRGGIDRPYRDEFILAIEGANQSSVILPLIEFTVLTDRRTCTVTARCNEPGLTGYFCSLLLAMAVQWPETEDTITSFVAKLPKTAKLLNDAQMKAIKAYLLAERAGDVSLTKRNYETYSYRQTKRFLQQAAGTGQLDALKAQMRERGEL